MYRIFRPSLQTRVKLSVHKIVQLMLVLSQIVLFAFNFGGDATMKIIISLVVLAITIVNNTFNFVKPAVLA